MAVKIKHSDDPIFGDDFDLEATLMISGAAVPIDGNTKFWIVFKKDPVLQPTDEDADLLLYSVDHPGMFVVTNGSAGQYDVHVQGDHYVDDLTYGQPYEFSLAVETSTVRRKTHVRDVVIFQPPMLEVD